MNRLNISKIKSLSNSSFMPNMSNTLTSWLSPLTIVRLTQSIDEGYLVTNEEKIDFQGTWQPLNDRQLELKVEGQRAWTWIWLHAQVGTLELKTADKVIFNDKRYKVMTVKDYSLNGFIEYHLCRDYEDDNNNE